MQGLTGYLQNQAYVAAQEIPADGNERGAPSGVSKWAISLRGVTQARLPTYRRHGDLCVTGLKDPVLADEYGALFAVDACENMTRAGLHRCGQSCFKYDKSGYNRCGHGFDYYARYEDVGTPLKSGRLEAEGATERNAVSTVPTVIRRKGKYLESAVRIAEHCLRGRGGKVVTIQENPIAGSSHPVALVTGRSNFDLQDMRRVLPESILPSGPSSLLDANAGPEKLKWSWMENYNHARDQPRPNPRSPNAVSKASTLAAAKPSRLVEIMRAYGASPSEERCTQPLADLSQAELGVAPALH